MPSRPKHWLDWVAPDIEDPPPGSTGTDRDGAHVYFGCRPWEAASEGQQPGQPPEPTSASLQPAETCSVCGVHVPAGMTCAGCLTSMDDAKLKAEVVRDVARAEARAVREAIEKSAFNYAQRKFGKETVIMPGKTPQQAQGQGQDANIEARAAALADDLIAQADAPAGPPGTQALPGFELSDEFKAKAKEFGRDFFVMAFKYALSRFGA